MEKEYEQHHLKATPENFREAKNQCVLSKDYFDFNRFNFEIGP